MKRAVIALNATGLRIARKVFEALPGAEVYLLRDGGRHPEDVTARPSLRQAQGRLRFHREAEATSRDLMPEEHGDCFVATPLAMTVAPIYFDNLGELVAEVFPRYQGLVFIMAVGIVVRVVAPHIGDKRSDPAVVALDEAGRFAVSLLSGHEGGANALALEVSNACGAQPVITTASEALKPLVVGIGARRGVAGWKVVTAIRQGLALTGRGPDEVRCLATIDLKAKEAGFLAASAELDIPLRVVPREAVRTFSGDYHRSTLVRDRIGVEGVCEPCALLAAKNPRLILPRKSFGGVMVAVVEEGLQ